MDAEINLIGGPAHGEKMIMPVGLPFVKVVKMKPLTILDIITAEYEIVEKSHDVYVYIQDRKDSQYYTYSYKEGGE